MMADKIMLPLTAALLYAACAYGSLALLAGAGALIIAYAIVRGPDGI